MIGFLLSLLPLSLVHPAEQSERNITVNRILMLCFEGMGCLLSPLSLSFVHAALHGYRVRGC